MNRESLENSSRLHALEAEVKHLKGLLNKVSAPHKDIKGSIDHWLELKLEGLIQKQLAYEDLVIAVLKEIGRSVDIDRVSIYDHDDSLNGYLAKYQWCNDRYQEYYPSDLIIQDNENPLINPTHENAFTTCFLNQDLEKSLALKFEIFQVQSLLILSYSSAEIQNGFVVFETCSFNREWYDFEIQEQIVNFKIVLSYLNSYWYKKNEERDLYYRNLLHNATRIISKDKQTKKSIYKIFDLIGKGLHISKVYFVPKASFSNHHEFYWSNNPEAEENGLIGLDVEKLIGNKKREEAFIFTAQNLAKENIDGVSNCNVSVNTIVCNTEVQGWLVTEFKDDTVIDIFRYTPFINSVAHLVSSLFCDLYQESELNTRCLYLLEANRALTIKESFLEGVLKNAPVGIVKLIDGTVKLINDKVCEIFELGSEEILNKPLQELLNNSDTQHLLEQIKRENSVANKVFEIKVGLYTKVLSVLGSLDYSNKDNGHLLFISDVTSQFNIDQKYSELKDRYEKILETSIDGVIITDINANVKFINKSARELLHYDLVEANHLNLESLLSQDSTTFFNEMHAVLYSGNLYRVCSCLKDKDGKKINVDLCVNKVLIDHKEHYYITVHEISFAQSQDPILVASEKEFKRLAHNSPDIILRLNRERKILFYNEALISHFSFLKDNEVIGKSLTELNVYNELVGSTWKSKIDDAINFKEKTSMELGFSDESLDLYFDWIITPELNDAGEVDSLLAIGRSLTERKKFEKQLMEAKVKAEESDKLKSSFLANMSHELRTPLNAIVGFSALLRGSGISEEEKEDYVDVIHKNSDSLMSLINNIIDVAKIESGKISVEKEEVDIHEILKSLYADFSPKVEIEHKGRVKLYLSIPKNEKCILISDPIRLRQMLVNLIGNAIKFTIKGFIEFGYTRDGDLIRFFVKDTGIGISEAKQKIIFQPFRKEVESNNQIYGGTGVGLSICEKIIQALGGEIGLNSEKGEGSEFFFTHPIEVVNSDDIKNVISHKTITISNPVLPKNYYWPNKLILLVDENSSSHLQMRKFIEKTGLTLVSARTAAGASKLLMNRKDIHLVLMDLKFPDSTGQELVRVIKGMNKSIPVIAHSEVAVNGNCSDILNQGFDACISKPTQKDELLMVMDKFLVEANNTK